MTRHKVLASAVKKLGPERAEQMLKAFTPEFEGSIFCGCALAHAYGNAQTVAQFTRAPHPDNLQTVMREGGGQYVSSFAARLLGITDDEALAISNIHFNGRRHEDWPVLVTMLEAEAAKMHVSVMQPAGRAEPSE